ncbi:hypothetical protein AGMMS49942_07990 [Spirochaetia bacterium]|nr:hypothetical protein AGMMS49942_07990 [Spirochaetia bacterium]
MAQYEYKKKTILGLSGGRNVASLIDFIKKTPYPTESVALMGRINSINLNIASDMVVLDASKQIGGSSHIIHCPAILASKNDVISMKKNPVVSQEIALFDQIDLAIVGIGSVNTDDSMIMQSDLLTKEDITFLRNGDYVGEICGRFFNRNGEELEGDIADRTISITLNQLKKVPLICMMASGNEKIEGIRIAANAGFFHVLITDEETAKALAG